MSRDRARLSDAVIRLIEPRDLAPVLRLVQLVPEAPTWTTDEFRKLVAPASSPGVFAPQATLLRPAWIAERHAQLLGLIVIQCVRFSAQAMGAHLPAAECEVESIVVHPEARRIGIGRQLLATAMEWCRDQGAELVRLEVRRSNHGALKLYEAAGFELSGVRPQYYNAPDEDAILMRRRMQR